MIKNRCKHCNISTDLFFCPNCGLVLRYPQFLEGDKKQKDRLQLYIKDIVQKALSAKVAVSTLADKEVLTNSVLSKFNEHILLLQEAHGNITAKSNDESQSLIRLLRDLVDKSKATDCHLVVSGKIGAGKSTFINALLGSVFSSVSIDSETTVLTKYRYSEKGNYIKLSYYKTHEWDALWQSVLRANQNSIRNDRGDFLSEFNRLSADEMKTQLLNRNEDVFYPSSEFELKEIVSKCLSCDSQYHYFVKEAEIGLATYTMPKNVVIVDALGLDDPVSYRVDLSNEYLLKSNIVLLCIKADNAQLSSHELKEYADLFSSVKDAQQIYIVGTQYDIPDNFTKYWTENSYPEYVKQFSAKSYYNSTNSIENRLLHVSAWYYNIIQKAKTDVTFWENEYNVDYLAEILCRTLGTTVAYQYGTDAISLKKCLEEHFDKIEAITNLPNVSNYIVVGPIRDFDRTSLNDFKNIYQNICNRVRGTYNQNYSRPSSELTTRMIELDSKIARKHHDDELEINSIKVLIKSLENKD